MKVMLCSLILTCYYFIALRNKAYHHYNRFYLLSAVVVSWLIPLLPFNIFIEQQSSNASLYSVVDFITKERSIVSTNSTSSFPVESVVSTLPFKNIATAVFLITCLFFSVTLIVSLFKINRLKKTYAAHKLADCTIYLTNEKYTPYSFFKSIFWNSKIELSSKLGQQILKHELVHIEENHSLDKLLIQINLIVGWFNPFFWIIKSELELIHEFIADRKSIPNGNTSEFAQMILSIAQVNKNIPLTNPFFFSPIKRRLLMLTQKSSLKFSYFQRIVALPILISLVLFTSLKTKQVLANTKTFYKNNISEKQLLNNEDKFSNNISTKQSVTNKVKTQTVENNLKTSLLKDSEETSISELQKQYYALEQQYKKETAIAIERRKLMELLEKQSLEEATLIEIFNSIINTADDKESQKTLRHELEQKLGKEKLMSFWKEKNQIKKETEEYLKN